MADRHDALAAAIEQAENDPGSAGTPKDMAIALNPSAARAARTPEEERRVRWNYYLEQAIEAVKRDPARDILVGAGYDIATVLEEIRQEVG